jgi:hypothetical protein
MEQAYHVLLFASNHSHCIPGSFNPRIADTRVIWVLEYLNPDLSRTEDVAATHSAVIKAVLLLATL